MENYREVPMQLGKDPGLADIFEPMRDQEVRRRLLDGVAKLAVDEGMTPKEVLEMLRADDVDSVEELKDGTDG